MSKLIKRKNQIIRDIRRLRNTGGDAWDNYGVAFEYVPPGMFEQQNEGYWRWYICCGGPSDSFRFFASTPDSPPYKILFHHSWGFDHLTHRLVGKDLALLEDVFTELQDVGAVAHQYEYALEVQDG